MTRTFANPLQKLGNFIVSVGWPIWTVVGISAVVLDNLVVKSVPKYPDLYDGNIDYRWITGSDTVGLVLFGVVLACIVGLGITRTLPTAVRKLLAIGIVLMSCTFSLCSLFFYNARTLTHKSSIVFAGNTYYLAVCSGSTSDWDGTIGIYIVYKCDRDGIICHKFFEPPDYAVYSADEIRAALRSDTRFIIDSTENKLYVRIGADTFDVHYNQEGPEAKLP